MTYLKSGLKLIGGKTKIRDRLYKLFPTDYTAYYEPFAGSYNVFVGSPKVCYESTNDINWCAVNYMKHIQHSPEAMWKEIQKWLEIIRDDRFNFYAFRDAEPEDPLENAVWFYFITKLSMNGIYRRNKSGKCNSSYCQTTKGRGFFTEDWLFSVHERIKDAQFHCMDFKDYLGSIPKLLPLKSFVFVDPPYKDCKTTYNGISFKNEDFVDLFNLLNEANYDWMMTINDDPWIRDLFKGFNFIEHSVDYSCSQTSAGRCKAPELIITNYNTGL